MASVFLSYSREDLDRIRPLAAALEKAGHHVWWDRHIAGGEEFAGAIEQALAAADVVVVVWSSTSVKSAWVRDEAAAGRDSGRLIPVTLDGCQPPLGFRQYQTIDLSRSRRPGSRDLQSLKTAIEARAGAGERTEQLAVAPGSARRAPTRMRAGALAVGVAALLVILASGLIYSKVFAGGVAPKVQLGQFALTSPDLPRYLPQIINRS